MTHILDFKNIRKYKSDLPPSGLVQQGNQPDQKHSWVSDSFVIPGIVFSKLKLLAAMFLAGYCHAVILHLRMKCQNQ